MSMCEGICSNGHLYSLFYKIKSGIRSITCVSIVSVNISIGNGGERVYREQKDKVHMHAAVHTKTEGIREKNRVTDMRTHLQTHPHIKHETKQVCPTDRNKWGSKQKGKGTIGKTNSRTPIQTPQGGGTTTVRNGQKKSRYRRKACMKTPAQKGHEEGGRTHNKRRKKRDGGKNRTPLPGQSHFRSANPWRENDHT